MVQSLFDHVHVRSTVVETTQRDGHHVDPRPGHCERPLLHWGMVLNYQKLCACAKYTRTNKGFLDFWPFQSLFVIRMVDCCIRIQSSEKTTNDDEIEPPGRRSGSRKLCLTSTNLSLLFFA